MKKVFIVFSILLSFNFSYSQNVILERKIEWTTKKTNEFNKTKNDELWFSDATIDGDIPVYQESINLYNVGINSNNVSVKIIPIETETTNLSSSDYNFKKIQIKSSIYSGRDIPYLVIHLKPFVEKNGVIEKLITFKIEIKSLAQKSKSKNISFVSNSVLNSGKWVKIGIPQSGVYKLTYSELESLGFSSPANVRVFGNDKGMLSHWNNDFTDDDLIENTIYKGSNFILFFAEGPEKWAYNESSEMFEVSNNIYCDTAYYFLTDKNTGFANSIQNSENSSQLSTATITSYYYNDVVEEDLINILHSGRIWLGESFLYDQQKTYSFDVPDIIAGQIGKIKISNAVRSSLNSSFTYSFSGVTKTESFSSVSGVHYLLYADYQNNYYDFNQVGGTLNVGVNFNKPTSSSEAWLDKIIINVKRSLVFYEQMTFRSLENIGATNYSKFQMTSASSNVLIWDVTEPTAPKNQDYSISSSTITFTTKTDTVKEFIAFTPANCLSPVLEGNGLGIVANQDIHNIPISTDMIVVAPKIFQTQAEQFAEIHRTHDNYNVVVTLTDEIYNEFGSGASGAPQIRNYLKMAYEKTGHNLKYVLLLGDGTYNNFGETTSFNPNYIPTYETLNSFNSGNNISTTTDDFYALLDEDEGEYTGKLDIAVGRLPVKTTEEADAMIAKLQMYYSMQSYGDWRNIITLVSDDNDGDGDFVPQSEALANKINQNIPYINIKKIYLDAYMQQSSANGEEYPDAVTDFNNRVNNGSLIVNYIGHGSEEALSGERLVTRQIINSWNNLEGLALFITGTCEFSKYDNASTSEDKTSAGEMVVLNPNGGAIVMLTTARVSYSGSNLTLNDNFYDYLFLKQDNDYLRIGDAYFQAKNDMNNSYNVLVFTLLGDPAVKLQYADNKVHTDKINAISVTNFEDTLQALDKVTVSGYITDDNDNLLDDFNGILALSFFDKRQYLVTLNNDGNGADPYWSQYNKLFRGRASVTNGNFSISFIIPKDIMYNYGNAKFSYYANSSNKQATGYYKDVILGGINPDAEEDNIGPKIRLFMNDSSFVDGGMTDANPSVFAILNDENGINTSSASIGHDILATIDNNPNKAYSLNEYYQSDLDNYRQGTVDYGLFKLSEGTHTVSLKAWDIYNNSSEKTITFVVTQDNNIIIKHLLNYPNPFTTNTNFYFEHNKPGQFLDVLLQIFTVSGKLVKTIHAPMTTDGYRSDPINWDGLDDFGNKIGSGAYIYRVKVRTSDGRMAEEYEKLLILK